MAHAAALVDRLLSPNEPALGESSHSTDVCSGASLLRSIGVSSEQVDADVIAFERAAASAAPVARQLRLVPDRRSIARLTAFRATCLENLRAEDELLELGRQTSYGRDAAFLQRLSTQAAEGRLAETLGVDRITVLRKHQRVIVQEKRRGAHVRLIKAVLRMREIEKRLLDDEAYRLRRRPMDAAGLALTAGLRFAA